MNSEKRFTLINESEFFEEKRNPSKKLKMTIDSCDCSPKEANPCGTNCLNVLANYECI